MAQLPHSVKQRLDSLPNGLRRHIERSRQMAAELAKLHGVDADRAELGILCHDLARAMKGDALLEEARRLGIRPHPVQERSPVLLHGPVAASWLERDGAIEDAEVLEAVRWHTTGRCGMGPLEKVVFLADKLDPEKLRRYPYLERIRSLAQDDLDSAILEFLNEGLVYFVRQGQLIHPESVELRNELLTKLRLASPQDGGAYGAAPPPPC